MGIEENKRTYPVGTLLEDTGKLGVISKIIQAGALKTECAAIRWRMNYEICYIDGDIQIIGHSTLVKLIDQNIIKILS
jgi:hypothetical protein